MFRHVSNTLYRSTAFGIRSAIVNRPSRRSFEHLSYKKDSNLIKREPTEDETSRENWDESTQKVRSTTETVFSRNGVNITAYSEVSCRRQLLPKSESIAISFIKSFRSQYGFRLNDNIKTLGPIVLFPRAVFPWHISCLEDINEDSLCIFYLTQPRVDTLIIGTGDQPITREIGRTILEVTRKHRINIEILSTETACTTFNFLNQQGRMVAAALVPPRFIPFNDDDVIATQSRDNKLFSMDKMTTIR